MRLILLLLALVAIGGCDRQNPEQQQEAAPAADSAGSVKSVDRSRAGKPVGELRLMNAEEEATTLAGVKGKPVLVNFWAVWCAPCVKELPTLDALSKQPGAPKVIAISEDSATRAQADAFLADHKLGALEVWRDPDMTGGAAGVQILPTTILIGSDGKEIWRYAGDLDWTGAEAKKLLAEAR